MPKHDFSPLFDHYPALITQMPESFTSHEFIQKLAQQHQVPYIEALHSYRDSLYLERPAPFKAVHSILAQRLNAHPERVISRCNVPSVDIFGQTSDCAQWKKL